MKNSVIASAHNKRPPNNSKNKRGLGTSLLQENAEYDGDQSEATQTLDLMIDKIARLEQSQNKFNSYASFVSVNQQARVNRSNNSNFNMIASHDHIVRPSSKDSNRISSLENHPASQ